MPTPRPITEADLLPLQAAMSPDFPGIWRDIATSLYGFFVTNIGQSGEGTPPRVVFGTVPPPQQLAQLAVDLTVALANDIGGDTHYIPIGHFMKAGETARMVIAAFKGHNHHEVAKLANITVSRVRQILRSYQKAEFERRQGRLSLD